MDPKAVYSYLVEQGYDPDEAEGLAYELSAPTGYNDLPVASYTGEVLGGGAAALGYKYLGAEGYMGRKAVAKHRARLRAERAAGKSLKPSNVRSFGHSLKSLSKAPLPGLAKLGVISAGALAGSLAGEAAAGEDFWDSATTSESLGSMGGSIAGGVLGEKYGAKIAASALAKKAAARAAGTGLARFASARGGAMLGGRLGAVGGSIVPGLGTAIGTGVGTVLGAVGGSLAGRYLDSNGSASDAVDRMAGPRYQENIHAGARYNAPQIKKDPDERQYHDADLTAGMTLPGRSYEDLL